LPGISKWPHLAQTNAPSASAIIGMNSLPYALVGTGLRTCWSFRNVLTRISPSYDFR